jgi:hypothetical protein
VETVLVRDEVDVVGAHIAFSLNAGVDFVIALDHESQDGTTGVLESYERLGVLRRVPMTGRFREQQWRTVLARMAAAEHGADWVVNSDADQFWWPRAGTLHDALAAVPDDVGAFRCWDRVFVPTLDDGRHFAERMTYRFVSSAPLNVPWSNYRPLPRVIHRGDPHLYVGRGSHRIDDTNLRLLASWTPVEALHFPWRSVGQMVQKTGVMSRAFTGEAQRPGGYHEMAEVAAARGTVGEHYASLAVEPDAVKRGLASGVLVEDHRLRDVLRALAGVDVLPSEGEFQFAGVASEERVPLQAESPWTGLELALEDAAAAEAEAVRLQRRIDELTRRVAALES